MAQMNVILDGWAADEHSESRPNAGAYLLLFLRQSIENKQLKPALSKKRNCLDWSKISMFVWRKRETLVRATLRTKQTHMLIEKHKNKRETDLAFLLITHDGLKSQMVDLK